MFLRRSHRRVERLPWVYSGRACYSFSPAASWSTLAAERQRQSKELSALFTFSSPEWREQGAVAFPGRPSSSAHQSCARADRLLTNRRHRLTKGKRSSTTADDTPIADDATVVARAVDDACSLRDWASAVELLDRNWARLLNEQRDALDRALRAIP